MKIQIRHRFSGAVIFEAEADGVKAAVLLAISKKINLSWANLSRANLSWANLSRADLSRADLSRANLSRANLSWADLSRADLSRADLSRANLSWADLSWADLSWADLSRADLSRADLSWADLSWADLSWADLSRANLSRADLSWADLSRADLSWAKNLNKFLTTPFYLLFDQPGRIRAYKLVKPNGQGPFNGGIVYEVGKSYEVPEASTKETESCAVGISLASLDWCLRNWETGYRIFVAEFEAKDIAAVPIGTDGKFRVRKCAIVGEKNLADLGPGPWNPKREEP